MSGSITTVGGDVKFFLKNFLAWGFLGYPSSTITVVAGFTRLLSTCVTAWGLGEVFYMGV